MAWEFTQEMNNPHPAPFPVKLINEIISSTFANIILDPFMGSGTTALAAVLNNRQYIGIEISPEYITLAESRVKEYYENILPFEKRGVTYESVRIAESV